MGILCIFNTLKFIIFRRMQSIHNLLLYRSNIKKKIKWIVIGAERHDGTLCVVLHILYCCGIMISIIVAVYSILIFNNIKLYIVPTDNDWCYVLTKNAYEYNIIL